jgi:UPF0716 protein FxsA
VDNFQVERGLVRPHSEGMQWIIFLFPWLELWTLIELGGEIGGFTALLYVFATLMLGLSMIRGRGIALMRQMQQEQGRMFIGPQLLADETALIGAGLLLMIPGLITDVLALICLVGPLRRRLLALLGIQRPEVMHTFDQPGQGPAGRANGSDEQPIEGDFRRLDD